MNNFVSGYNEMEKGSASPPGDFVTSKMVIISHFKESTRLSEQKKRPRETKSQTKSQFCEKVNRTNRSLARPQEKLCLL